MKSIYQKYLSRVLLLLLYSCTTMLAHAYEDKYSLFVYDNTIKIDRKYYRYYVELFFDETENDEIVLTNVKMNLPSSSSPLEFGIPERLNSKKVTTIGANALRSASKYNHFNVYLPNTITRIEESAFEDSGLRYINFEGPISYIGNRAFKGTRLQEIDLSKGVSEIGDEAFMNCYSLKKIDLPKEMSSVGKRAFMNCEELKTINWPNIHVNDEVFRNCVKLDSFVNKNEYSPVTAGDYAFANCSSLKRIKLMTPIGDYALQNCSQLQSFQVTYSGFGIGTGAFSGLSSLKYVYFLISSNCYFSLTEFPDSVKILAGGRYYDSTWWSEHVKNEVKFKDIIKRYYLLKEGDISSVLVWPFTDYCPYYAGGIGHTVFSNEIVDLVDEGSNIRAKKIGTTSLCPFDDRECYFAVVDDIKPPCEYNLHVRLGDKISLPTEYRGIDIMSVAKYTTCNDVTWYSDHDVMPIKSGSIDIKFVTKDDSILLNTYHVEVAKVLPTSSITLRKGQSQKLSLNWNQDSHLQDITSFKSSNDNVATVDENGVITAVGPGSANIICTTKDYIFSNYDTCKVVVPNTEMFGKNTLLQNKGGEIQLPISEEDYELYTFTNSDTNVAQINSSGKIECINTGTTTIRCFLKETGELIASCQLIVYGDLSLSKSQLRLRKDETASLTINSDIDVSSLASWKSTNESVATVDGNGKVKGIASGTAIIQYISDDGKVLAQCEVMVYGDALFDKKSIVLEANKTYKNSITADVDYSKIAQYISSDNSVVTVDESGLITAVASGTATIKYVLKEDPSIVLGQYDVKVFVNPALDKTSITLKKGDAEQLRLNASIDLSDDVVYESENTDIASVDAQGMVTGKTPGTTRILCKLKDDLSQVIAQCVVKVYGHVSFGKESVVIEANKTYKNSLTTDGDYSDMAQYISSDNSVVTVDESGLITAVASGTATIKYVLKEDPSIVLGQYDVKVFVNPALDKTSITLKKGDAEQLRLNASIDLSDDVVYESENTDIASVDAQGVVTGKTPGTTRILCKLKDDLSQVLAQCEVKVYGHVSFDKESVVIEANKTYNNSLTTDGDYSDIAQYVSTDNSVVTVDGSGLITAVASGTASIKFVLKDDPTIVLDQYDVKVYENLALNKTSMTLKKGNSDRLTLSASIDISEDIIYESENASVASVDAQGLVQGLKLGTTRILCKSKTDASILATCEVMVISENTSIDKVGGIYYEFSDNGEAMVTNAYGGILPAGMTSLPQSYSGSISIPEQVSHNGMNYHVTAIGENAFNGQSALQSVSMPNSVNAIGASAFRDCANLQTIQLSNSLTKILDLTFYGCSSLKNIALPQSIQSIGKSAFRDCQALTSLMFNKELESIGNYAFHNSGLKSIDLSLCSSLTSISPSVFANNKQLTNVVLPANLSSLGYGAFDGDESLSEVTFTTTTDHLTVSNNAFRGCTSLKKVFIADLKSWAQTNFMNPSANPLSMAHHLYLNGNELTKVELPQGTTIINNNAFYGFNSMTSLVIPSSVTQVGDNIFYGCTLLWDVYCKGSVPPVYVGTADASQMNEFFRIATLHIPAGSKKAYTNEEKKFWSRFTHIDEVIVSVTSISFNKSRLTLTAGETFQLVAEILPADASNKNVSWRSNNTNYVKVSAEGLITALLPGSASIYATTEDGGLVAKCFVTVIGNPSAINDVTADEGEEERVVYRLDGTRVHDKHLSPGIYIINGRKVVVKRVK